MPRAVPVAKFENRWQGENRVVKSDVRSHVKFLHIENSNDYYYQVIHKSFPHYPHFPQLPILNKKFTNTKPRKTIKSIIVIIPNFIIWPIVTKIWPVVSFTLHPFQSSPARSAINTLSCSDQPLSNFSNIRSL